LFNGAKYSLVDAAYAPFLQCYFFLDRIRPIGQIPKYPRLKAWTDTLMKRPSTHSFPEQKFDGQDPLRVPSPVAICSLRGASARKSRRHGSVAPT
jgi:hypothetical protein